jgi:hypothetical protein
LVIIQFQKAVSYQISPCCLSPSLKEPLISLEEKAGWAAGSFWTHVKKSIFYPPAWIQSRSVVGNSSWFLNIIQGSENLLKNFIHYISSKKNSCHRTSGFTSMFLIGSSYENSPCKHDYISACNINLLKPNWLRDAPSVLTFNNCTLYPHCIYVLCLSENKQRLVSLTS